ncbi:DUF748 domain-containing protein, partial [Aliarcobacter lanthieri]|uniref:DUF748 domain-containing protein n=1 Tax=Aliarcobacter lanthieri TaxID=1355374 RepID=UPI003AA919EC
AKVTGNGDPTNIKILTDVNMTFQNMSMRSFTPYTAKSVGRDTRDGKLGLDLKYKITESN